MNKKGVFFTFAAIFIIILIISITSTHNTFRYRERSTSIAKRVSTMDNFISDVDGDFDRELFIGGYRALLGLQKFIREKEGYIDNLDLRFREILVNATVNGTQIDLMRQEGQGADIISWTNRINEEANKIDIGFNFSVNKLYLMQKSPWEVTIVVNATYYIDDLKGLVRWNITKMYEKDISIIGFEDPLYIVETNDKVSNLITMTPDLNFVSDLDNDTAVLTGHLNSSYYLNTSSGPSFLMRFTGNFSNSTYGIESMVNLLQFQKQSIEVLNKSVIDHIYFGSNPTVDLCNIQNMPVWFRIDAARKELYEIDELESEVCS